MYSANEKMDLLFSPTPSNHPDPLDLYIINVEIDISLLF